MHALLEPLMQALRTFTDQRTDLALILRSPAADSLPVLTAIDEVEAESAADLFWIATDAFVDQRSYVDGIVDTFLGRQEALRLALAKEGLAEWPRPPSRLARKAGEPADILRQACAFSRDLLPEAHRGVSMWVFYPLEIADPMGFSSLMAQLLEYSLPEPWCQRIRFVIRAAPDDVAMAALAQQPGRRMFAPDLGPAAVERALSAVVDDDAAPVEERMGTLMMLAGADQARHDHVSAFQKYALLRDFHAGTGDNTRAAVALGGMAEAAEAIDDNATAGDCFEQALTFAGQEEHPPVPLFLNLTMGIGRLRLKEDRYAEGEAWFDMAQQLAIVARNVPVRIQALELRGACQQAQHRFPEAEQSWIDGSVMAAQVEDTAACRGLMLRLTRHYRDTGQMGMARERYAQLIDLGHTGPI